MAKVGRPTKKTPEMLERIKRLAHCGLTLDEIAGGIGVPRKTLKSWRDRDKEFAALLKKWQLESDQLVEESLRRSAMGHVGPDGKYYPPNATSLIFWLKNRNVEKWRDRKHVVLRGFKLLIEEPD